MSKKIYGEALTASEHTFILKVAFGHSNKEIAKDFYISIRKAKEIRTRIFKKLGAKNAPHAVYLLMLGKDII